MAKTKWKNSDTAKELIGRLSHLQVKDGESFNWCHGNQAYKSKFEGPDFETYMLLLEEQVCFNDHIPESLRTKFMSQAVFHAADNKKLNIGYISEQIRKLQQEYISQPEQSYTLITKISLSGIKSKVNVQTPHSKIVISKYFPKTFKSHYDFSFIENNCAKINCSAYSWTTVTVKARCENSAASKALSELSFYLGVINLFYNYGQDRRSFGTRYEPVNKLRRFKYHMLHLTTGERASKLYWYESDFVDYGRSIHYATDVFQVKNKMFRSFLKDIQAVNRYPFYRTVFNRYVDALESSDMNKSFRSLWALLETLTFTGKDNYSVTIHRTVALFKDKFLAKQKLELLRERRNMAIHSDTQFNDAESMTYMLMGIVNGYLMCMLDVMKLATCDKQIKDILDLPYDVHKLNEAEQLTKGKLENITIFKKLAGHS
ncbi:hypothetical protein [Vibrio ouci]|uniref:Apea-like HEPN domain-containing protein n=1 Tax=Vibrio ouci TaxID=2499078 RepID=A0A4Y8WA01_9VIBR|nr:hypothetical protein [Vibrio ouci]TFH89657.1 hypothetical protein ELS82_21020 [Vibrio ouci]